MLTAILIDDEESNVSSLKEKINRHCRELNIIALCYNAADGIEAINSLQPDIVFLDIEMPVMNGFLLLQNVTFKKFELIFTTAYDHYAIKAIRFSALDYLLKPIEIEDLKNAVNRATEKRTTPTSAHQLDILLENLAIKPNSFQKIAIPTTDGLQFIKISDILYLEANMNYTYVATASKKFIVCQTLKIFEEMLPADTFIRIHNSYIINKNFVEKYIRGEGGQVVLSNGIALDVSKRKKGDFLKAISF
jgi:two-component system LytT family response regulator